MEVIGQYFFPEKELAEVSPGMPDNIPKPMTRTEATDCIDIIHTTIRKWAEAPNGNRGKEIYAMLAKVDKAKIQAGNIQNNTLLYGRTIIRFCRHRHYAGRCVQHDGASSRFKAVPFPLNKATNAIRRLWSKVPDGWHKNPYAWAGICCTLVFFALFIVSWVQWHDYQEENRQLRTVADKHKVTTVMLNELHPGLAVTIGAYEKLTETVGADSTLTVFWEQVKTVRKESKNS